MSLHIGIISPEYPHPKVNSTCAGIGTANKNLIDGLIYEGYKVSLFLYSQDSTFSIEEGNLKIYSIKKRKFKFFSFFLFRIDLNKYINNIIIKENIDIVEAADWTGITAFMRFRVPLIIRLHGSDTFFCNLEKRKHKFKNYIFEKLALINSEAIIGVSNYVLKKSFNLFNLNKPSIVIPNGLFIDTFKKEKNTKFSCGSILYYGSIIRKKGVLDLALIFNEVVKINPNAILTILGRDIVDNKTEISTLKLFKEKLSNEASNNFIYGGIVPYKKISKYILKSQVCVFPSLAESFGMVSIEAMLLNKAIVNTNYPWAKEIIINESMGLTADPKNHLDYANKINKLLENPSMCLEMGIRANKHIVDNYNMSLLTKLNINFYKEIINEF